MDRSKVPHFFPLMVYKSGNDIVSQKFSSVNKTKAPGSRSGQGHMLKAEAEAETTLALRTWHVCYYVAILTGCIMDFACFSFSHKSCLENEKNVWKNRVFWGRNNQSSNFSV